VNYAGLLELALFALGPEAGSGQIAHLPIIARESGQVCSQAHTMIRQPVYVDVPGKMNQDYLSYEAVAPNYGSATATLKMREEKGANPKQGK
jgi:hypothetical protein